MQTSVPKMKHSLQLKQGGFEHLLKIKFADRSADRLFRFVKQNYWNLNRTKKCVKNGSMASLVMRKTNVRSQDQLSIRWIGHIHIFPYGNEFLSFVTPVWKHDFLVVKFPADKDEHDNIEITRQLKKNGKWVVEEYNGGYSCDFCETHTCDCAQYTDELESMIDEVAQSGVPSNNKPFIIYHQFTSMKYCSFGNGIRRKLNDYV